MAPKESRTGFFKGVRSEWRKIAWPNRKEIGKYFVIVVIITLFLSAFIYLLDVVFQFILGLII